MRSIDVISINADRVPSALKDLPQWLVWLREERSGKSTKVPYDASTGNLAKVNDPSTWCTFETALAVASGAFDGIGFVLTPTDPLGKI